MDAQARLSSAPSLPSHSSSSASESPEPSVLMTCEVCDLVGGPFAAAEAAHLRAVHNRLHHGILMAA
jgi:hypothetical protein